MKARLLKDTPDLKAGAIFKSLCYNASTKDFIDTFDNYEPSHVFHFLNDKFTNESHTVGSDDYIFYTKKRILSLVKLGWFEIIEDETE